MSQSRQVSSKFRRVRMELVKRNGERAEDTHEGLELVIPLDDCRLLDVNEYKHHQSLCRVRRFRPKESELDGRLCRKRCGQWYFEYENGDCDDELALGWSGEHFHWGEHISVRSGGLIRT